MKMLRTPIPNAYLDRLENRGTAELLGIFESCLKTGSKNPECGLLPDVWGRLFSDLFLSADELVADMQRGEYRLGDGKERMLREFIRNDCAVGGTFVLKVINNGGSIDRAALIMIADLEDLAGIHHNGTTAIHLFIETCDKRVRPMLIMKAGRRLLSELYDRRGIPAIFSIFGLCDLTEEDLDAIALVFSRDDLRKIMSRSRTGNTALDVFTYLSASLKKRPSLERNAFCIPAAKDTKKDEADSPVRIEKIIGADMNAEENKKTGLNDTPR